MGYCPICGSWPALIESRHTSRSLRCSFCAFAWSLSSARCIYCTNAGENFVAAALDVSRPKRRVELCGKCGGYTKVVEIDAPTPFPLLAIDDLATLDLDKGAMARGYARPDLFDLDTIAPRQMKC
jgi:FdhE protein